MHPGDEHKITGQIKETHAANHMSSTEEEEEVKVEVKEEEEKEKGDHLIEGKRVCNCLRVRLNELF